MLGRNLGRPKSQRQRSNSKTQRGYSRNIDSREEAKAHYPRISSPTSSFHLATKGELEKRESIEVCSKHGGNIVAFEEATGETLCETCVYKGNVEKPVFTATVAKGIKKAFFREYDEFQRLVKEFFEIDQKLVRDRIQTSIIKFFNLFRHKIDELERKTVDSIHRSKNLDKLINSLESVQSYLEDEKVEEKYDTERNRIDNKIDAQRFTYVCQRKAEFDKVIDNLKKDNREMAENIYNARSMIDSIFEVTENEARIEIVLSKLAADCMKIDEKRPDFGTIAFDQNQTQLLPEHDELIADRVKARHSNSKEREQEDPHDYLSSQMNSFYLTKDNSLWVKEIDGDTITETVVMPLKLYLQKVATVPTDTENRVFLFGGAHDMEGKVTVDSVYEADLDNKKLIPCPKMSSAKLSMACGISPDCKHIVLAGGSEGSNTPTNTCEIFDVEKKGWKKLPTLNCPRMSPSLIVCPEQNVYCFGGIESDPVDPSKFVPLKSIEWINYDKRDAEWEVLKIKVPYKGSSMGGIAFGPREFIIFGGWNRKPTDKSAYIWFHDDQGFCIEDGPNLSEPDTFISTGLTLRDSGRKQVIFFGVGYNHVYDEKQEKFMLFGNS